MEECIFCAIAAHRAPGSLVYEDDSSLAFLDLHPLTRGHTLVIPREHCANIFELSDAAGQAVMRTAVKVAGALRGALNPDGLNLLQSNGHAAGQRVWHFHFHLVPRWSRDGLFLPAQPPRQADREDLNALAAALHAHL
ncbi:MAG: HIT family protein [Anaerolineae bacterium]